MALDTAVAVAKLRSLTATFDQAQVQARPYYPNIATIVQSNGASENYGWLGSMPSMREWLGDRVFAKLRAARYELANKEWEASLEVPRTSIEDDTLGMLAPIFQQLGMEAMLHPDELFFSILEANGECFDGQYFFDTDHAWGNSGTQSNALSYTVASTSAVTESEFRESFEAARAAMVLYKRDNGKLWHPGTVSQMQLVAMVPAALEKVATRAFNKELIGNGESNVLTARPQIVTVPALASSVAWYLFRTDTPLKPFVFQNRRPLQRQMKGMDDREFKDVKFMTDARYNCGYLAWWNAVRTTFAT